MPRFPMTIRSAPCSAAVARMASAGSPSTAISRTDLTPVRYLTSSLAPSRVCMASSWPPDLVFPQVADGQVENRGVPGGHRIVGGHHDQFGLGGRGDLKMERLLVTSEQPATPPAGTACGGIRGAPPSPFVPRM